FYVSGHPLQDYQKKFEGFFTTEVLQYFEEDEDGERTYTEIEDGAKVTMGGIIQSWSRKTTKRGDYMAYITLEDAYGQIECVLFPKAYERYKNNIKEEEILKVRGTLKYERGSEPKVLVDSIEMFENPEEERQLEMDIPKEREWLLINLPGDKEKFLYDITDALSSYAGEVTVVIKVDGKNMKLSTGVRRCNALESELLTYLSEDDYTFFRK
ncbi:MAG: hypothetical protein J6U35_00020, partial [Clostridia bacterium]|nr:hypothetical protein [Clostridia bacterium]